MTALIETVAPDPGGVGAPGPPDAQRGAEGAPAVADGLAALFPAMTPERLAVVARVRASAPVWPPPIAWQDSVPRCAQSRPPAVLAGLTAAQGCVTVTAAGKPWAPCAQVRPPGWRCPACGTVTPVTERAIGPRLLVCECHGGVVCMHPLGPARPGARS